MKIRIIKVYTTGTTYTTIVSEDKRDEVIAQIDAEDKEFGAPYGTWHIELL